MRERAGDEAIRDPGLKYAEIMCVLFTMTMYALHSKAMPNIYLVQRTFDGPE